MSRSNRVKVIRMVGCSTLEMSSQWMERDGVKDRGDEQESEIDGLRRE